MVQLGVIVPTLQCCIISMHMEQKQLWSWLFPTLVMCVLVPYCDTGQWPWTTASYWPPVPKGEQYTFYSVFYYHLKCHVDWIWNQPRNKPLRNSVRAFIGRTLPQSGWKHLVWPRFGEAKGENSYSCLPAFTPRWWVHRFAASAAASFIDTELQLLWIPAWAKDHQLWRTPSGC